jgi:hypothetical protein
MCHKRSLMLTLLAVVLLVGAARADILHLKGGGKVEGDIISEDENVIRIKTRYGMQDIPRNRVESITRSKSVRKEFEERRVALAADDAQGHFDLAVWAKKQSLRKEAQALYEKTIEIDPMHKAANEVLGRVLHDGRYMTPEEKTRLIRESEDAGMAAKGLVRYKDRWVTPQEKDALERGLVKYEGKWMTPDEAKAAQGLVRYKGGWIKKEELEQRKDLDRFKAIAKCDLNLVETEHFRLFSVYPDAETRKVAAACERTYEDFLRDFGISRETTLFAKAKCRIFLFKKALAFEKFLDWYAKEIEGDASRIDLIRQNRGTYYIYPEPYVAGYQFPDPFQQLMARTVHKTSHILINAWLYNGEYMPWWITEGLGEAAEISVLGRCDTFCITVRGYNDRGGAAEKWQNSEDWKPKLRSAVMGMRDPSLVRMKRKTLNELSHSDLAKAWSVMSWFIEHRRERFVEFVRNLKKGLSQDDAFKRAFGKSWEAVDKEWREYVRNNY